MASNNLIERVIHNLPVKEKDVPILHQELLDACKALSPKCGDSCPIYKLNGSKRVGIHEAHTPEMEHNCGVYMNAKKMYGFFIDYHKRK